MFLEDLLSSPQTTQLAAIHAKTRYSLALLLVAALVPWSTTIGALDFENKGQEPKKMNQDLTRQFTSSLKKTRPRRSIPLKEECLTVVSKEEEHYPVHSVSMNHIRLFSGFHAFKNLYLSSACLKSSAQSSISRSLALTVTCINKSIVLHSISIYFPRVIGIFGGSSA
jgi:hypothetical protein